MVEVEEGYFDGRRAPATPWGVVAMHHRWTRPSFKVRLLIAEHNFSGGTETVSLAIIPEFLKLVDKVVWALPPGRLSFYANLIPPSDRLVYESLHWGEDSVFFRHSDGLLRRVLLFLAPGPDWARAMIGRLRQVIADQRLRHLVRKYRLTHFFTTWIFDQPVPKLPIPIGAMVMDLNWHHFPENFPAKRADLDNRFTKWLEMPM